MFAPVLPLFAEVETINADLEMFFIFILICKPIAYLLE